MTGIYNTAITFYIYIYFTQIPLAEVHLCSCVFAKKMHFVICHFHSVRKEKILVQTEL